MKLTSLVTVGLAALLAGAAVVPVVAQPPPAEAPLVGAAERPPGQAAPVPAPADPGPFAAELVLDDPAWAKLEPQEQVTAIERRLKTLGRDDKLAPRLILTLGWLFDTRLPDGKLEAAHWYGSLTGWLDPRRGIYPYAGQAKLRAAELLLAAGEEKRAQRELGSLVMFLQRSSGEPTFSLWQRGADGKWAEVDDPYAYVLSKEDELARDTFVYRLIDLLVKLTGNIPGWSHVIALILLAIGLKLAMYPLSRKSYRSMAEMQRVQPVVDEIRKKYKDNPQKLNEEMMRVYKEHGINPLGGCLPMLIQMPVFIMVYQGIRAYTYHFNHVRFLWMDSLAAPDTALLVTYGISMFVSQKVAMARQPVPSDPQQAQTQKMMQWFMPIFFTYMMYVWKLPSAFYLYWLTFNVISTIEQSVAHNTAPAPAAQPAAVESAPVRTARRAGRARSGRKARKRRGG